MTSLAAKGWLLHGSHQPEYFFRAYGVGDNMIFLCNILRTKARTLMTLLGIAGGIGVFVAISSITSDLSAQIIQVTTVYETDVVIQEKRAATPAASKIKVEQMEELRAMLGDVVSPLVIGTLRETWNPYARLIGIPQSLAARIARQKGETLTPGRAEVMAGVLCAEALGLNVGQALTLAGGSYQVTGIFQTGSRLIDGGMILDLAEAQRLLGRDDTVNLVLVQAGSSANIAQVMAQVRERFPGLRAMASAEFSGSLRIFRMVHTLARTIMVIALFGCLLIVTNTLLMAVAERTREIGILMAIGWKPYLVLRMLGAESLALCLLGAGLGNVLGLVILRLLNHSRSIGFGWIPVDIAPRAMVASFVIAAVVAIVALAWPAVVVLRLQPAEALRHE